MARRRRTDQLTPLELEIMKVLWEHGPGSTQAVQQHLAAGRPLAYTTVQTMLNVLLRKGRVKRTLVERTYVYRPTLSRVQAVRQTLGDVIDRLFGGSSESLVLGLVETKHLTAKQLKALQRLVETQGSDDADS
jgi:BlaI family penicillinase repressor